MSDLNPRETELVALAAALGSNCVPCIEYHIPQARKAGLTDREIHAAVEQADKVRQVPARKVLETAMNLLSPAAGEPSGAGAGEGCSCASANTAGQGAESANAGRTIDTMASMMSRMMSSCGGASSVAAGAQNTAAKDQEPRAPQGGAGCC